MNAKLIELKNDSMELMRLAGEISRVDYLNRMDALSNKWDRFILDTVPKKFNKETGKLEDPATFASELQKLVALYQEIGADLNEKPDGVLRVP